MKARQLVKILYWVMIVFAISSCATTRKGKNNTPENVSERFFTYLKNQDYDNARELGTPKTARIISLVQTVSGYAGGINILRDNKKELTGCETKGSVSVCTYKAFTGPDIKVYLVKLKGKWLVDLQNESDP